MKHWKRRLALFLAAALCAAALSGCGREGEGLELSVCVGDAPEDLDPIYASEPADQTVLVHLYENLMRRTAAGVTEGMARSAESEENPDGTVTWTFQLRNAEWSDGRQVMAADFVYAWQRLADPANGSPNGALLSVVAGYDAVQETGDATLLQVTAEDDHTLVVVLNGNYSWFLSEVCTSPATMPLRQDLLTASAEPDETAETAEEEAAEAEMETAEEPWWSDVTDLVTNGPYQVSSYQAGEALTLEASETYYDDISGPQTLTFRFAGTAEEGQALYDEGAVDFLGALPEEQMAALVEEESPKLTPELGVQAVVFNCAQDTLMDARVRLALSLVIDRAAAAEAAGPAAQAAQGLIPPGVPEREEADFRTVGGALLDNAPEHREKLLDQARSLLEEAGYADVQDLGELEYLYVDEGNSGAVAQTLVDAWQSGLGLRVTARAVTAEELCTALEAGTFSLAGTEIRALGNDAECFLLQWSSASPENFARYDNSAFDTLLSIIAGAEDETARLGCLHDAEALLLEEGAVAPLYTTVTAWTLRDGLTGVLRDGRGWFSFTGVVPRSE